jgi:REP element-mobilizing transposase RayT
MVTITTHERRPRFGTCENNACTLNPDGWRIYKLWRRITDDYPQIATSTLCIMPDHLHGILQVKERMEKPVGVAIRAFKSRATSETRKAHNDPTLTLWNPGYNDLCVWRRGALFAFTRYLMDNPRRYCLKKAHPELFRKIANLHHPSLPNLPPTTGPRPPLHDRNKWEGYGNHFLLDRPEKRALRISRKATAPEIAAQREAALEEAAQGTVIISPFISPGEKEIATAILAAPAGEVILLKHDSFPPHFKPNGRYFDLCCQGRLLILANPDLAVHGTPALTRETCLAMNTACAHIARPPHPPARPPRPRTCPRGRVF